MNTPGIIYTFSFLMFILVMFAFEFSEYDAFAKDQPSPLDGMNFSKSQDVYSKDGVLQTTISVAYKMGKVDNQSITAMLYNGSLPGPTLHVYPGDRVEIDLINNLNESTNLHFHGLHVSPGNNSDGSERIMYFLILLLVRHSIILSIFQKITLQVRYGIIHICIIFLMDKFRQVCLACLLLKG